MPHFSKEELERRETVLSKVDNADEPNLFIQKLVEFFGCFLSGLIVAAVLAGVFGFSGRFYDDEVTHIIFYVWLFIGTLPFSFGIIGLFLPNDTLNLANTIVNYFHPKENEIYK